MFNYKLRSITGVMPSGGKMEIKLKDGFLCRIFDINKEFEEIGNVIFKGYKGGADYEAWGVPTMEEVIKDTRRVIDVYAPKTFSMSS